jgi:hypothetical protein
VGSRILTIQRRVRELGRIRTGDSEPYTSDSGQQRRRARRSATFILTSNFRDQLDLAAELWGGTVEPWQPQGAGPQIWRVVTDTDALPAILPPADPDPLYQSYELWSGGGCVRRCNGEREEKSAGPCVCTARFGPEWWTRTDLPKGSVCKATTRLNVFLPLADFGFWRLETHSYWAATEIEPMIEIIRAPVGPKSAVPITLAIVHYERVKEGKRLMYPVVTVSMRGTPTTQILSGGATRAIEASPAPAPPAAEASLAPAGEMTWAQAAEQVATIDELRALWETAEAAGELDPELKKVLWARKAALLNAAKTAAPAPATAPVQAASDVDAIWTQILTTSPKGWTLTQVEEHFRTHTGQDPSDATAETMTRFLADLQAGKL